MGEVEADETIGSVDVMTDGRLAALGLVEGERKVCERGGRRKGW